MIRQRYRRSFESEGLEVVRVKAATGRYVGKHLKQAQAWIEEQDLAPNRKAVSFDLDIQSPAAGAMERQADAEEQALTVSKWALLISVVALAFSLLAILKG